VGKSQPGKQNRPPKSAYRHTYPSVASRRTIAAGGRSKMPGLRPVTLTRSRQAATVPAPPPQPKPCTCTAWRPLRVCQ